MKDNIYNSITQMLKKNYDYYSPLKLLMSHPLAKKIHNNKNLINKFIQCTDIVMNWCTECLLKTFVNDNKTIIFYKYKTKDLSMTIILPVVL